MQSRNIKMFPRDRERERWKVLVRIVGRCRLLIFHLQSFNSFHPSSIEHRWWWGKYAHKATKKQKKCLRLFSSSSFEIGMTRVMDKRWKLIVILLTFFFNFHFRIYIKLCLIKWQTISSSSLCSASSFSNFLPINFSLQRSRTYAFINATFGEY